VKRIHVALWGTMWVLWQVAALLDTELQPWDRLLFPLVGMVIFGVAGSLVISLWQWATNEEEDR
jgi:hypothetical protein